MSTVTLPVVEVNTYKKATPLHAKVIENRQLVNRDDSDIRHIVIDADDMNYLDGQSVGVIAPGLNEKGNPHAVRLYSIASLGSRVASAEKLTLTVKRVVYQNDAGETVKGVCSNYLCDSKPGDVLTLTGPAGRKFLLPVQQEVERPYIFMATGTGIAPFRGFLQRLFKVEKNYQSPAHLFMGARFSDELLYDEEFKAYNAPNFHYHTAISREQKNADGSRKYIQHLMIEKSEQILPLLQDERTMFYMCGLKGMEAGFELAVKTIAQNAGLDSGQLFESCKARLETETY